MSGLPPVAALFCRNLSTPEPPELGAGPRSGVLPRRNLEARVDAFFAEHQVRPEAALRLRSLGLLYHDHHDPAHDIVQDLTDSDGALIHGILHRREPDYWNAKYWFRRTDAHPVYLALGSRVSALPCRPEDADLLRQLVMPGSFDPFTFVDFCELVARRPDSDPQVAWLRSVQQAEFEAVAFHLLAA